MAEVGRHPNLSDADKVRLEHIVVHVAALEQFAQHVTHLLANAKEAYGAAFGSFGAAHLQRPRAFLDLEHFEAVARLDVIRVSQQHAALEARRDFRHIVLEAP